MRLILIFSGLAAMLLTLSCQADEASTEEYEEGVHYVALRIPIKIHGADKIEVTEYFSYGCPHCYQFEPLIAAWHDDLPDDVKFTRTPAIWNPVYRVYARTYYTASALNVLDKIHTSLFIAIQQQGRTLDTLQAMARFFEEQGISSADFEQAYESFGVHVSVQQADARGRAYRSGGVPAIIVNGKYRIEGSMAVSHADMLKIASHLIEKERQSLQTP